MKVTFSPFYIDLPVYLKVEFPCARSDKLSIGAGPLFSYGIGGKVKFKGSANSENITAEMIFFPKTSLCLDNSGNEYPWGILHFTKAL